MINNTVLTSYIPVYSQALLIIYKECMLGYSIHILQKNQILWIYMASIKQRTSDYNPLLGNLQK